MRIAGSNIAMGMTHVQKQEFSKQSRLEAWFGKRQGQPSAPTVRREPLRQSVTYGPPKPGKADAKAEGYDRFELEVRLLLKLLKKLTGKDFTFTNPLRDIGEAPPLQMDLPPPQNPQPQNSGQGQGWGVIYDETTEYFEAEATSFTADGVVKTSDGREIAISVEVNMSRSFYEKNSKSLRLGDAVMKDPLVINFDAPSAALTQTSFRFDLDSDGTPEDLPSLAPGSGYLAYDKNGNGVVDDGSELFGPATGEGFRELASHDGDGNGWIDEGDGIFQGLRVWSVNPDGSQRLAALGEAGVGAILVDSLKTPFALKTQDNKQLGEIKASSVFLSESGRAGTVQELNLVA